MKKYILTLCCALSTALCYAFDFEVNGIKYTIISRENLTVAVAADNKSCSGDIVIPSIVSYGSHTFNVVEISDYFLFNNPYVNSITINEGVKKIGNCAIFNQSYRSIDFISYPNSIDTLVFQAVGGCFNPRKIYIKDIKHWCEDVILTSPYYSHPLGRGRLDESGDNYGFLYVDGVLTKELHIPNNVTRINSGIFEESNIESLTISNSVKSIGYRTFAESLVSNVRFNSGLDSIGENAFYNTKIENINLPKGLKCIGERAFMSCKNAKKIQINDEVSELPSSVFQECSSAEVLILGSGITKIGDKAFADCGKLVKVFAKPSTPPQIEASSFPNGISFFATLYVPAGVKALYESAPVWQDFNSIVEIDNFEDLELEKQYNVNVCTTIGGVITLLDNTLSNTSMNISVKEGEDVILTFAPDNGYVLKSVEINGVEVINQVVDNSYTLSSVNRNTSIVVTFAEIPVYLMIRSADNGSIAQEVERGKVFSFVIYPSEGWNIESISFNGENVTSQLLEGNKYTTPTISSNSELNIVYKLDESSAVKGLRSESNVRLFASYGRLTIENAGSTTNLAVFTTYGNKIISESVNPGTTIIDLPTNSIYIVKVGKETYKVSI